MSRSKKRLKNKAPAKKNKEKKKKPNTAFANAFKEAGADKEDFRNMLKSTVSSTKGSSKESREKPGQPSTKRLKPGKKSGRRRKGSGKSLHRSVHPENSAEYKEGEIVDEYVVFRNGQRTVYRHRKVENPVEKKRKNMKGVQGPGQDLAYKSNKAHRVNSFDGVDLTEKTKINKKIFKVGSDYDYRGVDAISAFEKKKYLTGNEIELCIGLDFGTAFSKLVVQESGSGRSWAIPFTDNPENPFLFPTRVYKADGDCTLDQRGKSCSNLKLSLLQTRMPKNAESYAISYLALLLRHAKAWTMANKKDELLGHALIWSVSIGLPAANMSNKKLVSKFEKLLLASMVISESAGTTVKESEVKNAISSVEHTINSGKKAIKLEKGGELYLDQIGVFPELAAQIYGYVRSDKWDKESPQFMLVDIGGGTVDASIFNVTSSDEGVFRFSFYKSVVKQLGVYNLHEERLDWLIDCANKLGAAPKLQEDIAQLRDVLAPAARIPGDVDEYLINAKIPPRSVDYYYYTEKYVRMLWDDLIVTVRTRKDPKSRHWGDLPIMLCGGGSELAIYNKFVRNVNVSNSTSVHLRNIEMERPENMDAPGLVKAEYQRLSVAYGLSFCDIGEYITEERIKDVYKKTSGDEGLGEYISKDVV